MSTTTIRLSVDLKSLVNQAAKRADTSAHGFILEAISEKIDRDKQRNDFHDVAEERYASIVATGKTISWEQMRGYLEERAAGKKAARPSAKKLACKP